MPPVQCLLSSVAGGGDSAERSARHPARLSSPENQIRIPLQMRA